MNIKETIQLLGIQEVTTLRQKKNGTREFKLPVRDQYGGAIHVASFASGYVRRTKAGGYCPSWQLNKTRTAPPTKDYKWPSKERILIPNEQDRLAYLISFCLKNYYIGYANKLSSGEFIPKWKYEAYKNEYRSRVAEAELASNYTPEVKVIVNGHRYNVI
tara:strand:- start:180 stop:659 length:480 start_codon:yes stop_codon:yes gene_type:complete